MDLAGAVREFLKAAFYAWLLWKMTGFIGKIAGACLTMPKGYWDRALMPAKEEAEQGAPLGESALDLAVLEEMIDLSHLRRYGDLIGAYYDGKLKTAVFQVADPAGKEWRFYRAYPDNPKWIVLLKF